METREELQEKQKELRSQLDVLKKKIEDIDRDENMAEAMRYVGKFYRETDRDLPEHSNEWIRTHYVYGVDPGSCGLLSLSCSYRVGRDGYFSIEDSTHFWPEADKADSREYREIAMEEFDRNYAEIINRITSKYGRQLY